MVAMAQQRLEVVSLSVSNPKQEQKKQGAFAPCFFIRRKPPARLAGSFFIP